MQKRVIRLHLFCLFCFFSTLCKSQTLGGSSVFNFLRLPHTPQLTALGSINVSQISNDAGMAFYNPALLTRAMHTQVNIVFNDFYAGAKAYHFSLAYHLMKQQADLQFGLQYFDYGKIDQTDAAGNLYGLFRPVDYVIHVSAAKNYLDKWKFGSTLKFIHSSYGQYRSSGIAIDAGLLFKDSLKQFSAGLLARNMGFQLKAYNGSLPDDLPFDLQAGITKRLKNAPFSFSLTAHHLHQYDLIYNDTSFNNENVFRNAKTGKFTLENIFRHFVFATSIYIGDKLEVQAGYNHLRRKELNVSDVGNGLNGFSVGIGVKLNKLAIRYARSHYQHNSGYNQLGLNLNLREYTSLGKFGKRIDF